MAPEAPPKRFNHEHHASDASDQSEPWLTSTRAHDQMPGRIHAAVMAGVLGHDGTTAALPLSEEQLERANELLTPAEACLDYDHPNLHAWRSARGSEAVAIFVH
jgi:hypothetical protein